MKDFKQKGNVIIELIMVIMILILFGVTMYQLINQGSITEKKIIDKKMSQVDARIAISFINVRLKQNDIKDKIEVKELNDKNAIIIKERNIEYEYDTWIFFENGKLLECITDVGKEPEEILSTTIAHVKDFIINHNKENNTIENTVVYNYRDKNRDSFSLTSVVSLRSD